MARELLKAHLNAKKDGSGRQDANLEATQEARLAIEPGGPWSVLKGRQASSPWEFLKTCDRQRTLPKRGGDYSIRSVSDDSGCYPSTVPTEVIR